MAKVDEAGYWHMPEWNDTPAEAAARELDTAAGGHGLLRWGSAFLPPAMRRDYLEEQHAYLLDLPNRRSRLQWLVRELLAMPRYAYTVRTGSDKEERA